MQKLFGPPGFAYRRRLHSEHCAQPAALDPAPGSGSVEHAARAHGHTSHRTAGATDCLAPEPMYYDFGPGNLTGGRRRKREHRTTTDPAEAVLATLAGGAVEIAVGAHDQSRQWARTVAT